SLYHYHGVDAIWAIFRRTFPIINSILQYEPILRACLRPLLSQLAADGVRYVDFRAAFVFQYRREGSEDPEDDYVEWFRVFKEEVEQFKTTEEGKNFYGARLIWTTLRTLSNKEITNSMKECIKVKKIFPEVVCGFDLV